MIIIALSPAEHEFEAQISAGYLQVLLTADFNTQAPPVAIIATGVIAVAVLGMICHAKRMLQPLLREQFLRRQIFSRPRFCERLPKEPPGAWRIVAA